MQRIPGLPSLLLVSTALALQAQPSPQRVAALHSRTATFLAPFVPPIPGVPLTATYNIEVEQPLAGGGSEILHSITRVARDSHGRVRHELHAYAPALPSGVPPLLYVTLSDPVARLSHILDIDRRTDTRFWFHASHASLSDGDAIKEDLGSKIIENIDAAGERRTWLDASALDASGQPVRKVDEIWFSNALQLRVSEERTSFSGRVIKITLAHVDRGEPDAELFRVPHGYRVPGQGVGGLPTGLWSVAPPDSDESGSEGCCIAPDKTGR